MRYFVLCMSVIVLISILSCGTAVVAEEHEDVVVASEHEGVVFTDDQRELADQIISIFENSTPVLQYGYAEALNDGRGITAGRAGFTSATHDMLAVVEEYTILVGVNPLTKYMPRLEKLSEAEDGSIIGLDGLREAWRECAEDVNFIQAQDNIVDKLYYSKAAEHAGRLGISYPFGLLCVYDTIIQHGNGDDPDGLPAIICATSAEMNGRPADGIDELEWLKKFLEIRREVLLNPHNKETQEVWAKSVSRVDALMMIYNDKNYLLSSPLHITVEGGSYTLPVE